MLYPRSQIVTAAKAYGIQAIDLVRYINFDMGRTWLMAGLRELQG